MGNHKHRERHRRRREDDEMKPRTIVECIIREMSVPERINKNMWKNHFHYEVDIYKPSKRKHYFESMFMAKTKRELLKMLRDECLL